MTAVFDQGSPVDDQSMFVEGIAESESSFEEPITIKRFVSQDASPNALGQAPVPIYATFPATAVLAEMGVKDNVQAGGVLSAGDIKLEMRERLSESDENASGSNPGDRVIFRGAEYRLVMRPVPVVVGNAVAFYNTFLRRANLNSDQAGL